MKRKLGPGPAEIRFFAIAKAERGVVLAARRWGKTHSRWLLTTATTPTLGQDYANKREAEKGLSFALGRYEAARKGKR